MKSASSISYKSIKKHKIMESLYQHQLRPKVYYTSDKGWTTDHWYSQKNKNKEINTNLKN